MSIMPALFADSAAVYTQAFEPQLARLVLQQSSSSPGARPVVSVLELICHVHNLTLGGIE